MTRRHPHLASPGALGLGFLRGSRGTVLGASLALALLGLACGGAAGPKPPFDVQFAFHGTGTDPVYIRQVCGGLDFGVSSGASGYSRKLAPVSTQGICACGVAPCAPVAGGACESPAGVSISAGTPVNAAWHAASVELEWTSTTLCSRTAWLPAGKYRVAVRAFDTPEDAARGVRGWVVTRDFDLPAPDGVVDVPVGARAAEPCETAAAAVPTCTGHEARETACNLPSATTFSYPGGELATYVDTFKVAPPVEFSITRRVNIGNASMLPACATVIPRCSADARVITTSDLTRVLSVPAIAASFTSPPTFFGKMGDLYSYLEVQRAEGTAIDIGGACLPSSDLGCQRAVTPAAYDVNEAFRLVELQRTADGCVDYYRY